MLKIYRIIFNHYTNTLHNAVSKSTDKGTKYLSIFNPNGELYIVTDNLAKAIEYYDKFGGGIYILTYIGECNLMQYHKDDKDL